jgi:hypothetical protein
MAASDQISGQDFEYVALRWNFFFFSPRQSATGNTGSWNEHRDKHILFFFSDMMYSCYLLSLLSIPTFLFALALCGNCVA